MQKTALMTKTTIETKTDYAKIIKENERLLLAADSNIAYNLKMADHTTFKIGGPMDAFIEAHSPEGLLKALSGARKLNVPCFLLGGGSNLLVSDNGIPGIVIKNKYKNISLLDQQGVSYMLPELSPSDNADSAFLFIGSGTKLADLVTYSCENGLTGCEFLAGIPGTIGGAVYGNAGAYGKGIGDITVFAKLINSSNSIFTVDRNYFNFSYRTSKLKATGETLVSVVVKLSKGDRAKVTAEVNKIIAERHQKHPPETIGCAGSFFKNVSPLNPKSRKIAAGYFLEIAGAKEMKCGGAEVYSKHANFIINPGNAKASEVRQLATALKSKVLERFGILLEEEVLFIG